MNGTKRGSDTTYPSEVIFSCDDGFNLRGSANRECTADGTWNGVETICEGRTLLKGLENVSHFMYDIYHILFSFFCTDGCIPFAN